MLAEIQKLVDLMRHLDSAMDQLNEQLQVAEMNPDDQPVALRSALAWVITESNNAESALYELHLAVQTTENRAKRLHEAGNLD